MSMDLEDFKRRLSNALHDAETVAIEMRAARGRADGLDKTRLRKAVNATEAATKELLAATQALAVNSPWTARPSGPDEWVYNDGVRDCAILQKRRWGWLVHRLSSNDRVTGCDDFRTRAEAVDFITNGRVFRQLTPGN